MNKKSVYLFDMDGVVAKWETIGNPNEKGFFLSRKPEQKMIQLIRELKNSGETVMILSAVYMNGYASDEKAMWLTNNGLGDIPRLFVPYGSNKAEAIEEIKDIFHGNYILVDDYSKNLHEWQAAGHIAVKFRNGINGTHGTWSGYSISRAMGVEEMKRVLIRYAAA